MPVTAVNLPDGTQANVNHPDGATDDQILQYAKQQFDAGAFKQETVTAPQDDSSFGDYARAAVQGATFGFGDEAEAYARSMFGDSTYDQELGQIRGEMKQFEEASPYAAIGTEIVGSLATPMGFMKLPGILARYQKAMKAVPLGNVGKATVGGTLTGAAYGTGKSEGEIGSEQAFSDAVQGGAMGGMFGAVGQSAVQLGSFLTRTGKALANRASSNATTDTVRELKNRAYKEFDNVSEVADAEIILPRLHQSAKDVAEKHGYRHTVNPATSETLDSLSELVGRKEHYTVSQLDELRSMLYQKANRTSGNDANIVRDIAHTVDDYIDELIRRSPGVPDDAAKAARELNKRYRKMRMLEESFKKASHGKTPVHVAYKNAVQEILKNSSRSRFFSSQEIAAMHEFVKGGLTQRAAEYMARWSPGSNSLASLLQLTHVAINPKMAGLTAAAGVSQVGADMATSRAAKELTEFMGGGAAPQSTQAPMLRTMPIGIVGSEYYSE